MKINLSNLKHGTRQRSRTDGFSLVEVTMAIGILAFSFLTVFGLLSTSLNIASGSVTRTHQSRITQRLVTLVQQTPFQSQTSLVGNVYRFDGDGQLIGTGESGDFVYMATILDQSASAAENASKIGLSGNRIRIFQIKIAQNWRVSENNIPDDKLARFSFAVADMAL